MKPPQSEGRVQETRRDPTRNRLCSFHAGIKYKNSRTELQAQSGCFFVYDTFRLRDVLYPAPKLRFFCLESCLFGICENRLSQSQGTLRSLTPVFWMLRMGVRWGCCPKPCLRDNVPQTPFSASRRFKGGDLANADKTGLFRVRGRFAP